MYINRFLSHSASRATIGVIDILSRLTGLVIRNAFFGFAEILLLAGSNSSRKGRYGNTQSDGL